MATPSASRGVAPAGPSTIKAAGSNAGCDTTRSDLPSTLSDSRVVLPTVHIPVLSPGYPLARNTAAIEASTLRYFQLQQGPHGKRGRSAEAAAVGATPPTVLDTLGAETHERTSTTAHRKGSTSAPLEARTRAYLTKLFQEPMRCEQDVFRLVDVAHCRRALREEEEEALQKRESGVTAGGVARRVRDFNSCLTIGQHRRYRALVLEWLRHLPSRSAPPDSGEVLKVVQQEQRLFTTLLRQEATAPLLSKAMSLYEWLPPRLISFAKRWRCTRMQRQLLRYLEDAKAHADVLLLCRGPAAATSTDGTDNATAEVGYDGVTFEREDDNGGGGGGEATPVEPYVPSAQQLHQRRYPSLRVLQLHMMRLYNSQQTGLPAPFPNPLVKSSVSRLAESSLPTTVYPTGLSKTTTRKDLPKTTPSRLLLSALPRFEEDEDGGTDESRGEDGGNSEGQEDRGDEESATSSFASSHVPFHAASSIAVSALRTYVEQHLLPRFGWRLPRSAGGGDPGLAMEGHGDIVESVSLSVTFSALLKLFVAHIDTEEPRTSFRLPARVQLRPVKPRSSSTAHTPSSSTNTATAPLYRAHVMLGDVVPNVKESRHSVHIAAAEYLLSHHTVAGGPTIPDVKEGVQEESFEGSGSAAVGVQIDPRTPPKTAQVHLSRSATMQGTVEQGAAAVQAAGGNRIQASAAGFLSMKEAVADVAPVMPFHVVAPTAATSTVAPTDASSHVEFVMAKMEHLNATSAGTVPTAQTGVVRVASCETAVQSPYLLECLSPREMLQLDLIFACYPDAVVRLHRVQLAASVGETSLDAPSSGAEEVERMQLLAVEALTCASWAHLRQQLQHRPAESLLGAPTPAEVLATQSWDLLYDTLAWFLDAVERHATDALRAMLSSSSESDSAEESNGERFLYLILSNHANLVNTSESAKLYARKPRHPDSLAELATSSFTESRFAVRYVLQDASELYPDYEPRIDVTFEASNLRFLEEAGKESDNDNDDDGEATRGKSTSEAAARLYRDPHTWNADTIPFTFSRSAPASAASVSAPRS